MAFSSNPFEDLKIIQQNLIKSIRTNPDTSKETILSNHFAKYGDRIINAYKHASKIQPEKAIVFFLNMPHTETPAFFQKLWGDKEAREHFEKTLKNFSKANPAFKTQYYIAAMMIVPPTNFPDFIKDHADKINPLIKLGAFPCTTLATFLEVLQPTEAVHSLESLEAGISGHLAEDVSGNSSERRLRDLSVRAKFINFAFEMYERAGKDTPQYLETVRVQMRDRSITQIFTVATVAAELRISSSALVSSHLQILENLQQGGDPIEWIEDRNTNARLVAVRQSDDALLILCIAKEDLSLAPIFMDSSLSAIVSAIETKAVAFGYPLFGLTPQIVNDMGKSLDFDN